MRIVVDTNVFISALVFNKSIQELLELLLEHHIVLISPFIINELSDKLRYKFKFTKDEVYSITQQLGEITVSVVPQGIIPAILKDTDDNNILFLADFAKADLIISGDKGLVNLKNYKDIPIIKPSDFKL